MKVQEQVTTAKEDLQEAKDKFEAETDATKQEMLKTKLKAKQRAFDDALGSQRRVLDENMQIRLEVIRAQRHQHKKFAELKELRLKNKAFEKSYKGVKEYNGEKIHKRKKMEQRKRDAKKKLEEMEDKERMAAHAEKFQKYMAKESVDKINKARKKMEQRK